MTQHFRGMHALLLSKVSERERGRERETVRSEREREDEKNKNKKGIKNYEEIIFK